MFAPVNGLPLKRSCGCHGELSDPLEFPARAKQFVESTPRSANLDEKGRDLFLSFGTPCAFPGLRMSFHFSLNGLTRSCQYPGRRL
jgi:hypothetical protein